MKRVICYGDSNTWGNTGSGARFEDGKQWPIILQHKLGSDFRVIQEGLRARVAGDFETEKPYLNGKNTFEAIVRSSMPAELLVLALGTNDLKAHYARTAESVYSDLLWYAKELDRLKEVNDSKAIQIIFVAPPNFSSEKSYFDADEPIRQKIIELLLGSAYPIIYFNDLDMGEDGLHFSESAHERMAQAVYENIKELVI